MISIPLATFWAEACRRRYPVSGSRQIGWSASRARRSGGRSLSPMTELKVTSSATQTLPNKPAVALLSPRSTRPIIARLTPERAASSFKLRPAVARSTLSRFPMALSSSFWPIANSRAPRFRELRYFGTPELSLGFAREKLNETVGRDHRRKEIINALHRPSLLLRLLPATAVPDHNAHIPP